MDGGALGRRGVVETQADNEGDESVVEDCLGDGKGGLDPLDHLHCGLGADQPSGRLFLHALLVCHIVCFPQQPRPQQ